MFTPLSRSRFSPPAALPPPHRAATSSRRSPSASTSRSPTTTPPWTRSRSAAVSCGSSRLIRCTMTAARPSPRSASRCATPTSTRRSPGCRRSTRSRRRSRTRSTSRSTRSTCSRSATRPRSRATRSRSATARSRARSKKKEQARRTYEEAKAKGHTAALLEQEKRNIFKQKIANIAPHEQIAVQMQYAELLGYADGQYEIVAPLVVGPRYLPDGVSAATPVGAHRAGMQRAGRDVDPVRRREDRRQHGQLLRRHRCRRAGARRDEPVARARGRRARRRRSAASSLASADELPNRDLIVRYKTAAEQTMVGLLAHRTDKRGYFTLVVQPKATYKTGDITPREVMIVDRHLGLDERPAARSRRRRSRSVLIDSLQPTDTFNVMAFSGGTNAMAPPPIAGDAAPARQSGKAVPRHAARPAAAPRWDRRWRKALETKPGNDRDPPRLLPHRRLRRQRRRDRLGRARRTSARTASSRSASARRRTARCSIRSRRSAAASRAT